MDRIEDGPWALVLARIATAKRNGQLVARAAGKQYIIAFQRGAIVGASSPLAADAPARIASRVRNDDPALIVVHRAARTFALERGTFDFEPKTTIPVLRGATVDVRAVVFAGARLHLDAARIAGELASSGTRFAIQGDIAAYGFEDVDAPVLAALRDGASAPEIEAGNRDLDPRRIQALFYALGTCGGLRKLPRVARGSVQMPPIIPLEAIDEDEAVPMIIRKDISVRIYQSGAAPKRMPTEPSFDSRPTIMRKSELGAAEVFALINERSQAKDHFALLGVPVGATVDQIHEAYVEMARNLRAERLVELRIRDPEFRARGLLARICIAYTTLTDAERRAAYIAGMTEDVDYDRLAREAFDRGRKALKGDKPELAVLELRTACELAPNDISYIATLGHAEFCAAARR